MDRLREAASRKPAALKQQQAALPAEAKQKLEPLNVAVVGECLLVSLSLICLGLLCCSC